MVIYNIWFEVKVFKLWEKTTTYDSQIMRELMDNTSHKALQIMQAICVFLNIFSEHINYVFIAVMRQHPILTNIW